MVGTKKMRTRTRTTKRKRKRTSKMWTSRLLICAAVVGVEFAVDEFQRVLSIS